MDQTPFSSALVRSCTDLVILTLLKDRSMHGYDILTSMSDFGNGQFRLKQGTLYPVLYRLEREGWIEAEWQEPPTGKKRKIYRITPEGNRVRDQRAEQWQQFTASINAILKENGDD